MSDWIEQLERLTRLHKDGALTDEEFAVQKARLLEAKDAPAQPAPMPEPPQAPVPSATPAYTAEPVYEPEPAPQKSRVSLFVGLGVVAAGILGAAAWYGSRAVPDDQLVAAGAVASASPSGAELATDAPEPTPTPVALDGSLAFASPSQCQAGDTLEKVYKKLEAGMDLGSGRGLTVALDAFESPLAITAKSGKDKDEVDTASAEIRFPAETTWHGLKLSRVTASRYYPPESDGSDSRTLNFLEPPEKVRKTLARLGFGVPVAPDYAPLENEACGGSMQIEKRDGGSALVCTWGC
ncbi:MAG TPA: SHOCT domain-containing protein [Novosphingobium sp.]|nr:SHOCT domain-containing protein [Novosphingobium sp.]